MLGGAGRFERHSVAELFQPPHEPPLHRGPIAFVEILRSQILVFRLVGKQLIHDDQDRMSNRHGCAVLAPPGREAAVLCRKVGVPVPCRSVSGLN